MIPSLVLAAYGLPETSVAIEPFGSGLINHTWKVRAAGKTYILQRINSSVFKRPEDIAFNIHFLVDYLKAQHPGYYFVSPLTTGDGRETVYMPEDGYFRLFPFVPGSHSMDVVETPEQAYEAAKQFGRFTKLLTGLDARKLKITIPKFHDLAFRYRQFLLALKQGDNIRIKESDIIIKEIMKEVEVVNVYEKLRKDSSWVLRVTHHDTKISNVLFDDQGKGICVIDLDTIMPGYFISDVGDMMRTYLSPANEEETDFRKIQVREIFFKAIVEGYGEEMNEQLTHTERKHFLYAGKFMIYMQALRFLTDHINGDVYYGASYPGQNFIRAGNQMALLNQLKQLER